MSIFLCIMRYAKLCASALKIAIKYSCFDLSRAKGERPRYFPYKKEK